MITDAEAIGESSGAPDELTIATLDSARVDEVTRLMERVVGPSVRGASGNQT